ncbi:MAG TPA: hypothetical protein VK188_00315 [Holophaga sp.]|nr:hypothetical protein [Holophaga sp.]
MLIPASRLLFPLLLAALLGCGGASTRMGYTDPAPGGYRLVGVSTGEGGLVLDLVGPPGARIRGGLFTFQADPALAAWDSDARAGEALDLGPEPRLLKSRTDGSRLQVALYQKAGAATLGDRPLFSITLAPLPGARGPVSLAALEARILDASGAALAVPVAVGTLHLQEP